MRGVHLLRTLLQHKGIHTSWVEIPQRVGRLDPGDPEENERGR